MVIDILQIKGQKENMININDGGRSNAGYQGKAGDCVCRALSIAMGEDYQKIYGELSVLNQNMGGCKTARNGIFTKSKMFKEYMNNKGWEWTATMLVGQGCKVHLRGDELPKGRIICAVSKHYVAVIDGVVHDNHDSTRGGRRCVYGYWKQRINLS